MYTYIPPGGGDSIERFLAICTAKNDKLIEEKEHIKLIEQIYEWEHSISWSNEYFFKIDFYEDFANKNESFSMPRLVCDVYIPVKCRCTPTFHTQKYEGFRSKTIQNL